MIEKYFTVTSNSVELRINRVRINRPRPVLLYRDIQGSGQWAVGTQLECFLVRVVFFVHFYSLRY